MPFASGNLTAHKNMLVDKSRTSCKASVNRDSLRKKPMLLKKIYVINHKKAQSFQRSYKQETSNE